MLRYTVEIILASSRQGLSALIPLQAWLGGARGVFSVIPEIVSAIIRNPEIALPCAATKNGRGMQRPYIASR